MARPEFTSTVRVQFLSDQSPSEGPYAFSYTVTIRNTGDVAAQLIARQWLISNANGQTEEVRGLAVVGHQPLLKPGESFEYTSWTRIDTPQGTMQGTFYGMTEDAHSFESPIPLFVLAQPQALH